MITIEEVKEVLNGSFQYDILDSVLSVSSLEGNNKSFDIDLSKIPNDVLEKIIV